MSEEIDVCNLGYRQFLSERMKRTWSRIREEEAEGKVISFEDFGRILHEESDKLREARKKCMVGR